MEGVPWYWKPYRLGSRYDILYHRFFVLDNGPHVRYNIVWQNWFISFSCWLGNIYKGNKGESSFWNWLEIRFKVDFDIFIWVKSSVQVSITCLVENLIKQNLPLGEICMDSVNLSSSKFLWCSAWAMSFRSIGANFSSNRTSCAMHMSAVYVRFPLTTVRPGW